MVVPFSTPEDRADEEARRRIREETDRSFLVEAAAGTGKTTALVGRIVSVLGRGEADVHQIVAVTFTRKAAGELKLRLRQELEQVRRESTSAGERSHLERAIAHLEEARIGTIHSFCGDILRERPVEARVDPAFEELSEDEAPRLFERIFRVWIQRKLQLMPPALSRVLARLARNSWESPLDSLNRAAWNSVEWRDFQAPWERRAFPRSRLMQDLVEEVLELADLSESCPYKSDYLRMDLQPARFFSRSFHRSRELGHQETDELEASLIELTRALRRKKRKGRGKFSEQVSRQEVLSRRERLLEHLESFQIASDADLAAQLHELFREVTREYQDQKQARGVLDFVDLLVATRDLIRENQEVRGYLQGRFTRLFVDEFQDTDPLQAEILTLLSSSNPEVDDWRQVRIVPGKLFLVGDPKQSIYRFRRADVILYQQIRRYLNRGGVETLYLSRNFRSTRPLQRLINSAFSPVMTGDPESGQPEYVPLLEKGADSGELPAAVVLPIPRPYGAWSLSRMEIARGEPEVVAAFIQWLLESEWKIRDPDDPEGRIPVRPEHITILMRKFVSWRKDLTRPYVRELEARGIPHLLVGSKSLHTREEIETLRSALRAVEWPDDELSVFATLRGSLFAIDDASLFRYRKLAGPLHPFIPPREPAEDWQTPIREALSLLAELHRRRNYVPIVATISRLLEETRAHSGFALRPSGHQVLANLRKIWDMARRYEANQGLSLRGFVEFLNREAELDRSAEAPIVEEGAEGVRIMTLHAAKGLEAPVIVLAGLTTSASAREPDKYVDLEQNLCATRILGCKPWELVKNAALEHERDKAEGVRISYVAATRARDLLVVPGVGDETVEGWLADLNPVIYPVRQNWRHPESPPVVCPPFGDRTVLERPVRFDGRSEKSVRPGLHRSEEGSHRVLWWDPATLNLDLEPDFGLRQQELLAAPEDPEEEECSLKDYQDWKASQAEIRQTGGCPERVIFRPSEADQDPPGDPIPLTIEEASQGGMGSGGRRYGTLVHTVLRDVDWSASPEAIEQLARFHGRSMQAPGKEIKSAARAVQAALHHPRLARLRTVEQIRREFPISVRLEDDRLLEGALDLLYQEAGHWHVIDFKTDREIKRRKTLYERQLRWYVLAVSILMESPASGHLLIV